MNIEEFEAYCRGAVDDILNQLQTVNLLASQIQIRTRSLNDSNESIQAIAQLATEVETRIVEIGVATQNLSLTIESFISEQREE
jgi:hypothetical protein